MKGVSSKTALIILNGGKGSRMNGEDKDLLHYRDSTFLSSIIESGRDIFDEIIVVGKERNLSNVRYVTDVFPNLGPVGGIYTGIHNSPYERNVVVACDMPFINRAFFEKMLELSFVHKGLNVIPKKGIQLLPLSALYLKKNLVFFENAINNRTLKLIDVVKNMSNFIIAADEFCEMEKTFMNINKPEDYLRFKKILND